MNKKALSNVEIILYNIDHKLFVIRQSFDRAFNGHFIFKVRAIFKERKNNFRIAIVTHIGLNLPQWPISAYYPVLDIKMCCCHKIRKNFTLKIGARYTFLLLGIRINDSISISDEACILDIGRFLSENCVFKVIGG